MEFTIDQYNNNATISLTAKTCGSNEVTQYVNSDDDRLTLVNAMLNGAYELLATLPEEHYEGHMIRMGLYTLVDDLEYN